MIELRDIRKIYTPGAEEIRALDGVSLSICPGEFVAIMGASGSGKSTLMQILGLLDTPSSGAYKLFGEDVASLDSRRLAGLRSHYFGFVFQQFFLLPKLTALENAALPLLYSGNSRDARKARESLERVGLAERAAHKPNEMSGGQQQRVAIARALVNDPQIIFADEPTGNLDSRTKVEIMEHLRALNQAGKTIILVTHEEEMAHYARRIIVMRDGKILSDSAPAANVCKEAAAPSPPNREAIHFLDYLKQALISIWSHRTRSFLSVLGILIGIASVIAMLSLGEGASATMQRQLASLGSNMILVRPGTSRAGGVALESGSTTRLSDEDVLAIRTQIPHLNGVSGVVTSRVQVIADGQNANTSVEAVERPYEKIRNLTPLTGRFFSPQEEQSGAKVALLGATIVKTLWGGADPVGKTIRVNETYFNVIGVLPVRGVSGPRDQDDVIIIPLKTGMRRLLGRDFLDGIYVDVAEAKYSDAVQEQIETLLNRRHRTVGSDSAFEIRNMADIKATLSSMTNTMTALLGTVAAISLVVGGIGIMNIMLVAVVERTKEIGLRKAVGATRRDILFQFLFESVLLSLIGGLLGVALGAGVSVLMAVVLGWAVSVSLFAVILATSFSFVIGIVFGLWPALKASALSPIVALRYE